MNLGEKLLSLRKKKGLSQEEVADILHVTRQTISKWETNQSMPDFDKVVPICDLYEISTDELFKDGVVSVDGEIDTVEDTYSIEHTYHIEHTHKRALFTTIAVVLYIFSIVVIIFFSVVLRSPIVGVCIFFVVIAIATGLLVYIEMMRPSKEVKEKEKRVLSREEKLYKQITSVLALFVLVIYLIASILTMAWFITWILWIVYALLTEIIKLCFSLKGVEVRDED